MADIDTAQHMGRPGLGLRGTAAPAGTPRAQVAGGWGQTLFGFATPAAWAEIDYQQQTSLDNLIDAPALELAERVLIVTFGFGALGLTALALKFPRSTFAAIAPPASLAALAALCSVPGAYLRLEWTELLFALFFAFYGYRLYVAARSLKPAGG